MGTEYPCSAQRSLRSLPSDNDTEVKYQKYPSNTLNTLDSKMTDILSEDRNKPFHVIHTNGTFFVGYIGDVIAEYVAKKLNQNALDNGLADRYLVILNPDTKNTPEEEL